MRQLLAYLDAPPDTAGTSGEDADRGGLNQKNDDESDSEPSDQGGREDYGKVDSNVGEGGWRARNERFHKMTEEICDVVDSYGLVCFYPLNIQVKSGGGGSEHSCVPEATKYRCFFYFC